LRYAKQFRHRHTSSGVCSRSPELIAALFGIIALAWPGLRLTALTLLFGVYALADGRSP
jgi:uncharacterized membrane protein HdeD (DUF308 family)